jgi:hypothetical protein
MYAKSGERRKPWQVVKKRMADAIGQVNLKCAGTNPGELASAGIEGTRARGHVGYSRAKVQIGAKLLCKSAKVGDEREGARLEGTRAGGHVDSKRK